MKTNIAGEKRGNCCSSDLGLGKGMGPRAPVRDWLGWEGDIWASVSGRKWSQMESSVRCGGGKMSCFLLDAFIFSGRITSHGEEVEVWGERGKSQMLIRESKF